MLANTQQQTKLVRARVDARRSQRVLLKIAVVVSGEGRGKATFQEEAHTHVVSAHGALILLAAKVENGQKLTLTNKVSTEKQECKVVYLGPSQQGKTEIGVEFTRPAPQFWHVAFPHEDWKPPLD